jgi:asparagine synthase (glutamine-hydrolysing)
VITGEGADEMLAGYNIFKETIIRNFWSKQPDSKYRPLLLKKLYPYIPYIANASPGILKMFFGYRLEDTSSPFYSHLIRWNNTSKIKNYFSAELLNGHASYNPQVDLYSRLSGDFNTWSPLAKSQFLEINLFMSGYLLSSQGDRMAMANSVEGRYPFLDHRIIEFCASLPENLKLKGLNEKYLLKKLMENKLPSNIVNRSKQAYRAPISHMINGSKSSEKIHEILSESKIKRFGLFDPSKVKRLKVKYSKGQNLSEMDNMGLIGIISSQLLYDQFIENHNNIKPDTSSLNIKKEVSI